MNLRVLLAAVLLVSIAAPTLASAQEPAMPMMVTSMRGPGIAGESHFVMSPGSLPSLAGGFIPPDVAARVGISQELLERIEAATFEANEALIPLEADVRRAQLELERHLRASSPDEAAVGRVVDTLSKAEAAVRKNRLGLLIQVRRLLGPELWRKLEAALHEGLRKNVFLHSPFPPGTNRVRELPPPAP